MFTEFVKDKSGNVLLSQSKHDIYWNQNENIVNIINNKDWNDGFFQNQTLKAKIDKNIFKLDSYEPIVNSRFNSVQKLNEEFDTSFKKTILEILPNYEEELLKYSNNSLEKNIKKKINIKDSKFNALVGKDSGVIEICFSEKMILNLNLN